MKHKEVLSEDGEKERILREKEKEIKECAFILHFEVYFRVFSNGERR